MKGLMTLQGQGVLLGPCTHSCSLFDKYFELLSLPFAGQGAEDRETNKIRSVPLLGGQVNWMAPWAEVGEGAMGPQKRCLT